MTIQKRLFWSNILMIIVPVIASALVGALCVGFMWAVFINGTGLDMSNTENFNMVCLAVTENIENKLDSGSDLSSLDTLLENNGMSAHVLCGDDELYSFGKADTGDTELYAAAQLLTGNSTVSSEGRSLFRAYEQIAGKDYTIYLFGGNNNAASYANIKVAVIMSGILILFTIFISVLLTNRFLTRFVFRRIEEPLDILTDGVHQIRDGNLNFRINYERQDEFRPVCEDFNEMAEQLKKSAATIRKQNQSRKELLAGISHDIRSPLTSIQAYVEGLIDGIADTPEAKRRYLTTIKSKAESLEHIVSQLFLFSKMELGDYPDNSITLRLDEKIEAAVLDAKDEYAQHGLHIETKLEPVTVNADPLLLERVIDNIMGNSLKYKEKENGILCITLTNQNDNCLLTFEDDGPGVPDEALPHLFEVFYRSDPARQNPQNGSGLGLAIAENIITHAGGHIRADKSTLGGLMIEIILPSVNNN